MDLIDQHTKKIMEGCKERAREAGLQFQDESLEYIVTNRDLLELSPKVMIPTLYDYWVHDVEVLKEQGKYELYPSNPYETVINTRPAISFYNDNNPDWLNVMIFYHVIGHIDFFQNNLFFRHTWDYDFTGQALSDKRLIAKLRSEKGRWVDYIIEFARSMDNQVGYYKELSRQNKTPKTKTSKRLDFYFDVFLQSIKKVNITEYIKEINRYNDCLKKYKKEYDRNFFSVIERKYPEFEEIYKKSRQQRQGRQLDLIEYVLERSLHLKKEENQWMKQIIQIVRKTSLFFQPQIRTKIMNEGWASYWHEKLFLQDDRIEGHEVDFARIHAGVTSMPRVGLNPYALGMRLFHYIEDLANKGKYSLEFKRLLDADLREKFDTAAGNGLDFLFEVRRNLNDFMFINNFVDQDFINQYKLFVADKRLNKAKMVWEYYIKSKKSEDYRKMLFDSLYHPPYISVDETKNENDVLYLYHHFEGKPLVKDFISNTMMGIEYLWGGPVKLETSEVASMSQPQGDRGEEGKREIKWQRVRYSMNKRKLTKQTIS